ncbi:Tetratricopeptide repeat family protein [Giardia duodenalis]|uniref:Tetratricopeptide repeat family protein n=1 Tax=Giardia intestinalis TaxID=5741 RepID=V6TQX1_GIAIN|nr:Tetratricopeptide repeat family protein [Giardia intestinalis]
MDRTFFQSGCCTPAIPQMPEEEAAAYRRAREALEDRPTRVQRASPGDQRQC